MVYLFSVTMLWAFSFTLIGLYLAGQVDPWFSVWIRVSLAGVVFLPWLNFKSLQLHNILQLMGIGGLQLGLMYCFYYQSFLYLSVPEVLLLTVFTPIYVSLFYDLLQRKFSPWYLLTALVAVLGAIIIKYTPLSQDFWFGFWLVQGSNISFAIGQVWYKKWQENLETKLLLKPHQFFGWFYIGASLIASVGLFLFGDKTLLPKTMTQWGVLIYLGIVASGLGYFLWNKGACLVSSGTLAVMNNALVPVGLLVSFLFWPPQINLWRLFVGGGLILGALWFNQVWLARVRKI